MTNSNTHHDKLWNFIGDIRIAMLTTRDHDVLRSRPMYAKCDRNDGVLVFFINAGDEKVSELLKVTDVNVSFADGDDDVYVSCSGTAEIVSDPGAIDTYWSAAVEPWYPEGKDDPNLRLLRVHLTQAEYWEQTAGTFKMIWEMAKGTVSDEIPDVGENQKVKFA